MLLKALWRVCWPPLTPPPWPATEKKYNSPLVATLALRCILLTSCREWYYLHLRFTRLIKSLGPERDNDFVAPLFLFHSLSLCHMHMSTHTHTHAQTRTNTPMSTHTHTHTHTWAHTHTHTQTRPQTHTRMYSLSVMLTCTSSRSVSFTEAIQCRIFCSFDGEKFLASKQESSEKKKDISS